MRVVSAMKTFSENLEEKLKDIQSSIVVQKAILRHAKEH